MSSVYFKLSLTVAKGRFTHLRNAIFHHRIIMNPLSIFSNKRIEPLTRFKQQILDSSKLKEFTDDNLKFYTYGLKFSKKEENTVGKGEIARYEQFLLFPKCLQKTGTADT